jgi:hypothetical protein
MTKTDTCKQPDAIDTTNVIPFPDKRIARPQQENTRQRLFSQPLRETLRRITNTVLHHTPYTHFFNQPKGGYRRSATTSAAHHPEYPHPTRQGRGGRPARIRISA